MINEVFVMEIDKNGQLLALDFGCLEIFFFFFFFFLGGGGAGAGAKPGRLVDLCLFQATTMVMASG